MFFTKRLALSLTLLAAMAVGHAQTTTPELRDFTQSPSHCATLSGGSDYAGDSVSVQFSEGFGRALDSMKGLSTEVAVQAIAAGCSAQKAANQGSDTAQAGMKTKLTVSP